MRKIIVCFGDSNTHGYDNITGGRFDEDHRWTCLLGKSLGGAYMVCEEGLSGRTTVFDDPLTEGLSGVQSIFAALMTHEPVGLLIIMLGTNDVKERFCATPENVTKGLERLIRKAQATTDSFLEKKPRILVICPPPIKPIYKSKIFSGEMGEGCDVKSAQLAPMYEETAKNLGCLFLDAATVPGVEMAEHDGMHMQLQAHALLAKAIAKKIKEEGI